MAKGNDYKNSLKALGDRIKTDAPAVPIQEVRPVEPAEAEPAKSEKRTAAKPGKESGDAHVNFWVPADLMKSLKVLAAQQGRTIRELGTEALEDYLAKHQ